MKKARAIAVVICLGLWAACAHADFDITKVVALSFQLVPEADGVEVSPFPFHLGETSVPLVMATLLGTPTNVPVPPQFITITSQNSNIVAVSSNLQLTAIALGSNSLNFTVGSFHLTKSVKVVGPLPQLMHRYSFDTNADPAEVLDSVGGANGVLTNDTPGGTLPVLSNGLAQFDGSNGYVKLPSGIASQFTNLSMLVWIAADNSTNLQREVPTRILDFAELNTNIPPGRADGLALDTDFPTLHAQWGGLTNEFKFTWGTFSVGGRTGLVASVASPPQLLFGPAGSAAQAPKDLTNFPPLQTLVDADDRIGGSLAPGFSFKGALSEVRMYEGLLSDYDVAILRTNGPDVVPALVGDLRRIHLVFDSTPLELSNAQPTTVTVLGEFTWASNVDLLATGLVTLITNPPATLAFTSSNQFFVHGIGPVNLSVKSSINSSTLASMPVNIAGPLQISLQLPATNFSIRSPPVHYSLLGTYLFASNVDLTANAATSFSISNPTVLQFLSGSQIAPQAAGTAVLTAQYSNLTASVPITVTNPPGYAASYPKLVYRWKFNDPTNSFNAYDSITNAPLIGTRIDQLVGTSGGSQPVGTFAQFDGVSTVHLTGATGYFIVGFGLLAPLTNCTLEFWLRSISVHPYYHIFDMFQPTDHFDDDPYLGQANPLDGFAFLTQSSTGGTGGIEAVYQPAGVDTNDFYTLQAPSALASGNWTHIVWVHSPALGVAELYVNGVQVAATNTSVPFPSSEFYSYAWLGRNSTAPNDVFGGDYDEFRVYDGALSPSQILLNDNAGPQIYPLTLAALGAPGFGLQPESDGQHIKLKIPNPRSGIVLESSPTLGPSAVWTPVTATPQTEPDETTSVELPLQTTAYFRLHALN